MTISCDFRELLARSVTVGMQVWGLSETLAPPETVKELARLGDEATFLNAMGISPAEYKERLLPPLSFLDSSEAAGALSLEGERWRVRSVVTAANEALQEIGNSLPEDSTPARVGRLL